MQSVNEISWPETLSEANTQGQSLVDIPPLPHRLSRTSQEFVNARNLFHSFKRHTLVRSILITAVVGCRLASLVPLENLSYDLSFQLKPAESVTNAVLVYVNQDALDLGADQNKLSRTNYARLLDVLAKEGARLVFIDVLFDQPGAVHSRGCSERQNTTPISTRLRRPNRMSDDRRSCFQWGPYR